MKINKKLLQKLPKSHLELLMLEACLNEVDRMIFELNVMKEKSAANISVNIQPWKSESTIYRILDDIFDRIQIYIKIPPEKFRELIENY